MMNFQEIQRACSLSNCKLTQTDNTLRFQFPNATVEIPKDFHTGSTQVEFFVLSGWLPTIREFLDNQPKVGKEDAL